MLPLFKKELLERVRPIPYQEALLFGGSHRRSHVAELSRDVRKRKDAIEVSESAERLAEVLVAFEDVVLELARNQGLQIAALGAQVTKLLVELVHFQTLEIVDVHLGENDLKVIGKREVVTPALAIAQRDQEPDLSD
jgi:hypothetical protein